MEVGDDEVGSWSAYIRRNYLLSTILYLPSITLGRIKCYLSVIYVNSRRDLRPYRHVDRALTDFKTTSLHVRGADQHPRLLSHLPSLSHSSLPLRMRQFQLNVSVLADLDVKRQNLRHMFRIVFDRRPRVCASLDAQIPQFVSKHVV